MSDDRVSTESRSSGSFFNVWLLAYVLPVAGVFLVRQAMIQHQQAAKDEARAQEVRQQLESIPPEEMGPATRTLMGLDEVPPSKVEPEKPVATPEAP